MKYRNRILVIILIVTILSFGVGYGFGFKDGISMAITYGLEFVDIKVNEEMLSTAIFQYKNNIGSCLFNENASFYSNSRD